MKQTLHKIIKALVKDGTTDAGELYKIALDQTANWSPRPEPEEIEKVITETIKKHEHGIDWVRNWVLEGNGGEFTLPAIYKELEANQDPFLQATIRQSLHRLVEKGVVIPVGKLRGHYRRVEKDCPVIDLSTILPEPLDLYLPLGLHNWVKIYRKSVIVVAGESNKGKTAAALDFVKHNMHNYDVHYFFNDGGVEELKGRLMLHEDISVEEWNFSPHERDKNFEDVIFPDAINVIDDLKAGDNFWEIGSTMDKIFQRLNNGLVYINIQKGSGQELGRGGDFSRQNARLYVTMNTDYSRYNSAEDIQYGIAKVIKAKGHKKGLNPDGRTLAYSIKHGWKIRWEEDWAYPVKQTHQPPVKKLY